MRQIRKRKEDNMVAQLTNTALATARGLKTSPQKANLVLKMIRGMHVADALHCLAHCHKSVARDVKKLVESAIANAENNHQLDIDTLYVDEATAGRAFVLKRFHARARGRGAKIFKAYSHIRIKLIERGE